MKEDWRIRLKRRLHRAIRKRGEISGSAVNDLIVMIRKDVNRRGKKNTISLKALIRRKGGDGLK